MPRVIVIGGGVIGLSLAYELAQRSVPVVLLERGELAKESSWAGAGILTPATLEGAQEPMDRLRAHSLVQTASWSRRLATDTGIDNEYVVCGALEVAMSPAEVPGLEAIASRWRAQGVPIEELSKRELLRLEPNLSPELTAAIRLPTEAQLRNPFHSRALAAGSRQLGAELLTGHEALSLQCQGSNVVAAQTPQGTLEADVFVVTSGAWSPNLLRPFDLHLGGKPIRGQIALLGGDQPLVHQVVWAGSRYLVPRRDGRLLVGSTMEDAGFDTRPTAAGVHGLLELAQRLAPSVGDLTFEKAWAGLRPGSADGLPYIGPVPGVDNLFVAAGHSRSGVELAAGTALVTAQLLLGETTSMSLEAFRPDRKTA